VNHQTGVRGYLTNDISLLGPYNASLPRIKLHLKSYTDYKDDPNQQNRVDSLKHYLRNKSFSVQIIIENRANRLTNAQNRQSKNGEILLIK
jgi:CHASE3 domain sensor protein